MQHTQAPLGIKNFNQRETPNQGWSTVTHRTDQIDQQTAGTQGKMHARKGGAVPVPVPVELCFADIPASRKV